jgi:isopentenyldiphosphate isomerase
MVDELVDVIDENTLKPTGKSIGKYVAHAKGIWHLSVHVWIYNSKGEVLLQHRAKCKKLFPGMWDVSVAGHVGFKENIDDVALREMKEEIGLVVSKKDLEKVFSFKWHVFANDGMINNEVVNVYLYKYDGSVKDLVLQKEEVDDERFFKMDFLKKDIIDEKNSSKYLLGKNPSLEKVFELIRERTKKNN